jgi:hypothetical protein
VVLLALSCPNYSTYDTPKVNKNRYIFNFLGLKWPFWAGVANRPQDAVYPASLKDAEGRKYSGTNKYVMHFAKDELPPAEGFWSLTMYDAEYFFVNNPLNRYSISVRQNLKSNPDGSTDLYIQKDSPGAEKESNWLPAPSGDFVLMLRLYWPDESDPSIIDGSWKIPPVKKV